MDNEKAPVWLRRWFLVHFAVDILFAVPIFIAPVFILEILGWQVADPVTGRMVAAALFGIGTESLLCRNSILPVFMAMLNLKIIWSSFAIIGLSIAFCRGYFIHPIVGAGLLFVFILFNILWVYWRLKLR